MDNVQPIEGTELADARSLIPEVNYNEGVFANTRFIVVIEELTSPEGDGEEKGDYYAVYNRLTGVRECIEARMANAIAWAQGLNDQLVNLERQANGEEPEEGTVPEVAKVH